MRVRAKMAEMQPLRLFRPPPRRGAWPERDVRWPKGGNGASLWYIWRVQMGTHPRMGRGDVFSGAPRLPCRYCNGGVVLVRCSRVRTGPKGGGEG